MLQLLLLLAICRRALIATASMDSGGVVTTGFSGRCGSGGDDEGEEAAEDDVSEEMEGDGGEG